MSEIFNQRIKFNFFIRKILIFIDKRYLFVIVNAVLMSGRNSAVECYLAKVDVDGSNPFARSIFLLAA